MGHRTQKRRRLRHVPRERVLAATLLCIASAAAYGMSGARRG
jgi:hypothetical protein